MILPASGQPVPHRLRVVRGMPPTLCASGTFIPDTQGVGGGFPRTLVSWRDFGLLSTPACRKARCASGWVKTRTFSLGPENLPSCPGPVIARSASGWRERRTELGGGGSWAASKLGMSSGPDVRALGSLALPPFPFRRPHGRATMLTHLTATKMPCGRLSLTGSPEDVHGCARGMDREGDAGEDPASPITLTGGVLGDVADSAGWLNRISKVEPAKTRQRAPSVSLPRVA